MDYQLNIKTTYHKILLQLAGMGAVLFSLILLAGCDGGLKRVPMSGKVTYAGQPVADGQIRFVPESGTEMPITTEPIVEGRYNTKSSGGVPPGVYLVAILAYHPDDPIPTGPGAPQRRQLLPAKYNNRSELEITIKEGQKGFDYDFELPP